MVDFFLLNIVRIELEADSGSLMTPKNPPFNRISIGLSVERLTLENLLKMAKMNILPLSNLISPKFTTAPGKAISMDHWVVLDETIMFRIENLTKILELEFCDYGRLGNAMSSLMHQRSVSPHLFCPNINRIEISAHQGCEDVFSV